MSTAQLKTININELKPGMYVNAIIKQRGNMQIKSHGKVKTLEVIKQLKKKGILQLQIDLNKAFDPVTGQDLTPPVEALIKTPVDKSKPAKRISFKDELNVAAILHKQGVSIQANMLSDVAKNLPIDIAVPTEFTEKLVESIDRNPDALLCLSKIREKDTYLMEHSLNVSILLANFAKFLGLPTEEVEELSLAGFLHDIGKIKVPDEILHKPGRLTDPEMVIMKNHVVWGVETLLKMKIPKRIIRTMGEHHERLDGQGYPKGLSGDQISKFGRMIAIVDTYDAITADRCYKVGMPSQKALKILLNASPAQYDKELVQLFIKCIGVYPVGSLVKLSNQQVAMVVYQNDKAPLMPTVKIFYSLRSNLFITPKDVDLSIKDSPYQVESAVLASDLGVDFNRFFEENIAV